MWEDNTRWTVVSVIIDYGLFFIITDYRIFWPEAMVSS